MEVNQQDCGKILWIEDEFFHVQGLVKPLVNMGFKVICARSVTEAKSLLEGWRVFRLVILDLILPYSEQENDTISPDVALKGDEAIAENGIHLFEHMVDELKIEIPIIVMSVVTTATIVDKLMEKGAARRLGKLGLLPNEVKRVALDVIGDAN